MRLAIRRLRTRATVVLVLAFALLNLNVAGALAVQVPRPASSLFIQTSGPNAGIGIGDYYTSPAGGDTHHLFMVRVPSDWPAGTPVTVALYDPELAGPDPASPTAADEIRNSADSSDFRLVSPSGSTIANRMYNDATTNGVWTELATFDPGATGTGNYLLQVRVSDDDDNSWRVDASFDPDCVLGVACATSLLVNGNEVARAPSGSGSLAVGVVRTSWQHAGSGSSCQDHYFFVNNATPRPLRAHNFDMDGNGSVTYTTPSGTTIAGTVSGNGSWNGSSNADRVGDILPEINGWWSATICISTTNQYVFESPAAGPSFPAPQPAPRLEVSKSDGLDTVRLGDQLTYLVVIDNVSDEDTLPGEAYDVTATDTLPSGLTFVSCSSATMDCSESGGVVTAVLSGELDPGETTSFTVVAEVTSSAGLTVENSVTVSYDDHLGSAHESVSATDVDDLEYEPTLEMTVSSPVEVLRGDSATLTYTLEHGSDSDGSPISSPVVTCAPCTSINYVSGDIDTDGALDADEAWVYQAEIATGGSDPEVIDPAALASGTDRNGDTVTASVEGTVTVVEPASLSGVVFEDMNGNGILDAGEPGIDAVEMHVESGATSDDTATVDGSYTFIHLNADDYEVAVSTVPEGMSGTSPAALNLSLDEGEEYGSANFGFARPAMISGIVYIDADFDSSRDGEETGLEGATVQMLDTSGTVLQEALTEADGSYSFDVSPGTHQLRLAAGMPAGWVATTSTLDITGLILSGSESHGHDFGVGNRAPTMTVSNQVIKIGGTPVGLVASDPEGGPTTFAIIGGLLPAGLTLGEDGAFDGTAVAPGIYQVIVQVCDTADPVACSSFDLVIEVLAAEVLVLDQLPFTGVESVNLLMAAAVLLVVGSGTVLGGSAASGRPRRSRG